MTYDTEHHQKVQEEIKKACKVFKCSANQLEDRSLKLVESIEKLRAEKARLIKECEEKGIV